MAIAIIGAGIGGLTTAWHLQQRGIAYDLFEADPAHVGGPLRSQRVGPYLLELGPHSLQLSPALEALITSVGLADEMIDTAAVSQHRYVLRGGRLRQLPSSPPALLASGYFGLGTKFKLLRELLRRPAPVSPDVTMAAFFRERFGAEVVDYALAPFVSGVWAGDPDQLLVSETMPRLAALAEQHGSVIRGLAKGAAGTERRRIISLREGGGQLTRVLGQKLHHLHLGTAVRTVRRTPDGKFRLELEKGAPRHATYDQVVLGLPAWAAAPMLREAFPDFANALRQIHHPPMAAVQLAYPRAAVAHPLNGFGALYPRREGLLVAGSIWVSSLYPTRCPADQVLLTSFVGGVQNPAGPDRPDDALVAAVDTELRRLYGITAAPVFQNLLRWSRAIPQPDAQIRPARAALPALQQQGLWAVANWAAGVGVPDVVARAQEVAELLAG